MQSLVKTDVLMFVEDPGAVNFGVPLLAALAADGWKTRVLAAGKACDLLRARNIPVQAVSPRISAKRLLKDISPKVVLVGTSENPATLGLMLIKEARLLKIETVGMVDLEINAAYRFRGQTGRPLAHAPSWLLVPDEDTKKTYGKLGFPPQRVVVSGHPHVDTVLLQRKRFEREGRSAVRRRVLASKSSRRTVIVFLAETSQGFEPEQFRRSPDYTLFGRGTSSDRTRIVVEEFLDAARAISPRPYLVLRLHPKNTKKEFSRVWDEFDEVISGGNPLETVYSADLVVGMTTMLLFESTLLGVPTLSVVPRAQERNWLPAIQKGWIPCVSTRDELRKYLSHVFQNGPRRARRSVPMEVPRDAIAKAIRFFDRQLLRRRGAHPPTSSATPIETPRLRIVPFSEEHLTSKYVSWLNDPEVVRYSEQRHQRHSLESCRAYWRSFIGSPNYFWAVVAKDPNIGHIGNMTAYIDTRHGVADVGILVGEKRVWGKGYAKEAWGGVCRYLFENTGLRKITAGTLSVNKPMLGILRSTGMLEDGRRRRHYIWEGQEVDIVHAALFSDPAL